MKKLMLAMFLSMSILSFSAKITTNGKVNFDKMIGVHASGLFEFRRYNKKMYLVTESDRKYIEELKVCKKVLLCSKDGSIFGYDVKLKKPVQVDKNWNILQVIPKTIDGSKWN